MSVAVAAAVAAVAAAVVAVDGADTAAQYLDYCSIIYKNIF